MVPNKYLLDERKNIFRNKRAMNNANKLIVSPISTNGPLIKKRIKQVHIKTIVPGSQPVYKVMIKIAIIRKSKRVSPNVSIG